ncbi:MAG TPA: hypothetical protein VF682_25060 [Pseudomonas sp.]
MKRPVYFLLVATIIALASWMFWRYLGDEAFQVLTMVSLIALAIDNHRLRQQLKRSQSAN